MLCTHTVRLKNTDATTIALRNPEEKLVFDYYL